VSRTENLALYSRCYVKCIYQWLELGEGDAAQTLECKLRERDAAQTLERKLRERDAAHRLWNANFLFNKGRRMWARYL
jgi:hypothetical protein